MALSKTFLALLSMGVLLGSGCAGPPEITNSTPPTASHTATGSYDFFARVNPRSHRIVAVKTRLYGMDWTMAPTGGDPDSYSVRSFLSPCFKNIEYGFRVEYHRQNVIGSGYSSTIESVDSPRIGAHLLRLDGTPISGCPPDFGRVFTVTSEADVVDSNLSDGLCRTTSDASSGQCTLRAAVMQANASPGHDLIFVRPGHYVLRLEGAEVTDRPDDTFGDLDLTDAVTIIGASSSMVTIDGNERSRLFDIFRGSGGPGGQAGFVRLQNLRLTNGLETNKPGGAIFNRAETQIQEVVFDGNHVRAFAAQSCGAQPLPRECNRGGGIFNEGPLHVSQSTFSRNDTCARSATGSGLTCPEVTGQGGAIANFGTTARLVLDTSMIRENLARFDGGVQNVGGTVEITNSTFYQNVPNAVANSENGVVTLFNVTLYDSNSRALLRNDSSGELIMWNSIVLVDGSGSLCSGRLVMGLQNFVNANRSGCTITGFGPVPAPSLALSDPANHGGPTETMRVILPRGIRDAGAIPCPPVDQRGFPRPSDGDGDGSAVCDPGALEHDAR